MVNGGRGTGRFALEKINGRCGRMRSKDSHVPRVMWIGGRVSLLDARLLAGEFEGVEQEGHAEDAQGCGQRTIERG